MGLPRGGNGSLIPFTQWPCPRRIGRKGTGGQRVLLADWEWSRLPGLPGSTNRVAHGDGVVRSGPVHLARAGIAHNRRESGFEARIVSHNARPQCRAH